MMKKILLFASLFLVPFASAQLDTGVTKTLETAGNLVTDIFQNDVIVYVLSFLLFFVLLYSVFSAVSKFVPFFKADTGEINKSGKMFSVAVSLLSCFGIFYYTRERGLRDFLASILGPFGFVGALFIAVMVYALIYYGTKDQPMFKEHKGVISLVGTMISMMLIGALTNSATLASLASLILMIVVVLLIVEIFGSFGGKKDDKPPSGRGPDGRDPDGRGPHDDTDLDDHGDDGGDHGDGDWPPDNYEKRAKKDQFYKNFDELNKYEKEGTDYKIIKRFHGKHNVLIATIHGGNISPGAEDIAYWTYMSDNNSALCRYYSFGSLRSIRTLPDRDVGARRLFLQPSRREYDEIALIRLVMASDATIMIDTFKPELNVNFVVVSGKNEELKETLSKTFEAKGITTKEVKLVHHYKGTLTADSMIHIVNKRGRRGIQLQIPERMVRHPETRENIISGIKDAIVAYSDIKHNA